MDKEKALIAVAVVAANFPGAEKFFVTTDEEVFVDGAAAVEHACMLSAGNPVVIEIDASELPDPPPPMLSAEATLEAEKQKQKEAAQSKVDHIKAQLADHQNEEEISDDNMNEKILVAGLKKQLKDAEKALAKFN